MSRKMIVFWIVVFIFPLSYYTYQWTLGVEIPVKQPQALPQLVESISSGKSLDISPALLNNPFSEERGSVLPEVTEDKEEKEGDVLELLSYILYDISKTGTEHFVALLLPETKKNNPRLPNWQRVQQGDWLPDGWKVTSISRTSVTLQADGKNIVLSLFDAK